MPSPRGPLVATSFRTSRIIHAAMVASLVVYAVLVHGYLAAMGWKGTLRSRWPSSGCFSTPWRRP